MDEEKNENTTKQDYIVELENLQSLKEKGILTEMEYEVEKSRILNNTTRTNTTNTKTKNKSNQALTGFILGLCSLIAWIIPLIGYPVTILGIIFSGIGLNSEKRTLAVVGLILSIIFLIVTLMNSLAGVIMMSSYNY